MKNFSFIFAIILSFAFFGIGFYLLFLDNFIKNEFVKSEIDSIKKVILKSNQKIFSYKVGEKLAEHKNYLTEILLNNSVNCILTIKNKTSIEIKSKIKDTQDYNKIKKFIFYLENNNYKIDRMCIGQGCIEYKYGFFAKVRPYEYIY
jgi:hypothetical protein